MIQSYLIRLVKKSARLLMIIAKNNDNSNNNNKNSTIDNMQPNDNEKYKANSSFASDLEKLLSLSKKSASASNTRPPPKNKLLNLATGAKGKTRAELQRDDGLLKSTS